MNYKYGFASKLWDIAYPVLMYYATITIGILVAQFVFGAGNESYMLCKIIGSIAAIPVVFADYKRDAPFRVNYKYMQLKGVALLKNIVAIVVITLCMSIALNNLITMSPLVGLSEEYQNASDAFYGGSILVELLSAALITPYLEELLHRGVIFGRLRNMVGMWPAIILSSLIFAVLHFNIVQFVYAFIFGIILAIFAEKSKGLYAPVIAHVVANAFAVIRTEYKLIESTVDGSPLAWAISIALLAVGIVLLMVYIHKGFSNNAQEVGQ